MKNNADRAFDENEKNDGCTQEETMKVTLQHDYLQYCRNLNSLSDVVL